MVSASQVSKIYREQRVTHWDKVANQLDSLGGVRNYYHRRLKEVYKLNISEGARVLELGCGTGDLLAAVNPSVGTGADFSSNMLSIARSRHPQIEFHQKDVQQLDLGKTYDFILLSDLVNDVENVQTVLNVARKHSNPDTRIVMNFYSYLWSGPLSFAKQIGWATPTLPQNWLTANDLKGLMGLAGLECIRTWSEVLWPVRTPIVDRVANRYLAHIWPFRYLALTNFMVARVRPESRSVPNSLTVSVVVAARNEEGHIAELIKRTPNLGAHTEVIFVEGGSTDNTYKKIQEEISTNQRHDLKLFKQPGKGKGDAVRYGFSQASGDVFMILDADMTVPPENLDVFYEAIASGKGDFINGVRLVYPMEKQAMQFLNVLANKLFGVTLSWLLGQPIKDCLCGTKVLSRRNYERIMANRDYFGDFDTYGDFDLIFGAAKLNLKLVDLPIRYKQRRYGSTNMDRWTVGWRLLTMVIYAARRIKFV